MPIYHGNVTSIQQAIIIVVSSTVSTELTILMPFHVLDMYLSGKYFGKMKVIYT